MSLENNIPEGWVETSIGKVTVVESGGTPSTKNSSYWGDEIPWITPRDLSSFKGVFIEKGERSISIEGLENSSAKLLPKNTILFSSRAPIGYVVIAHNKTATNQGFKNLICDEVNSHFKYFYYLMKYKSDYIERLSSGSTFSEASGTLIKSVELNLPPITEQKAIAKVLTAFDDKIELLQAQNKTLETMAQTIFKEWFGKYQIGDELPEGWRVGKLDEVLSICGGTTPSTKNPDFWGGKINWTSPKDLSNSKGLFLLNTEKKITKEGLNKISSGLLPKGTLLLSSRAPVGYLSITHIELAINQGYIALLPQQYLSNNYMYLWLDKYIQVVKNAANGSTFLEISKTAFRNIECVIPLQDVLEKFDQIIEPIFSKVLYNITQIQSLTKTRDTLLPKLMSGQVRVNNIKQLASA